MSRLSGSSILTSTPGMTGTTGGARSRGSAAAPTTLPRRPLRRLAATTATALALGAASLLAPTGPAAAEATAVPDTAGMLHITGHGFGHGRGMSQWGAQGAALAGLGHEQILDFYYPGSPLGFQAPRQIRVKLTSEDSDLVVAGDAALRVTDQASGVTLDWRDLGPKARVVLAGDGFFRIQYPGGSGWVSAGNPAWPGDRVAGPVVLAGPGSLWIAQADGSERAYRGSLTAVRAAGAVDIVNTLDSEQYLYGVVPRESPSWFAPAALRAQAVAARSYANGPCNAGDPDYDVLDTTRCQVYGGRATRVNGRETSLETATAAVDATRGQVVTRDGAVLRTEFSASNGGRVVASNGWPARDDPYDARDPHNTSATWRVTVPATGLGAAAGVGTVREVRVLSRTGGGEWGGRVERIEVVGSSRTATITGATARTALGLKSDWFDVESSARPPGLALAITPGDPVTVTAIPASGGSGATVVAQATALAAADPADWVFATWGSGATPDVLAVKVRGTGSGMVEVHTLAGGDAYGSFSGHQATALPALAAGEGGWQFAVGSYDGSGRPDLFCFRTGPSGSGRTEVHVLSAASGYTSWVAHYATALPNVDNDRFTLLVGDAADRGDVTAVVRWGTGSGQTEVHRLTRASGYQAFDVHSVSALHDAPAGVFDFALGEYDSDGLPDLYALKRSQTPNGAMEVHVLDGGTGFTQWAAHTATAVTLVPGSATAVRLR